MRTEFYLDNNLINTIQGPSDEWYMNMNIRGKHNLEIITYDYAGNIEKQIIEFNKIF